jgi:hypothetical protein
MQCTGIIVALFDTIYEENSTQRRKDSEAQRDLPTIYDAKNSIFYMTVTEINDQSQFLVS